MGRGGGHRGTLTQKESCTQEKKHFFVMEKYIEDARQEEKHVPDLLEAITRPTCRIKDELWQNLFKMRQF